MCEHKIRIERLFNVDWLHFSIRQTDKNSIMIVVKEITNRIKIELRVRMCKHCAVRLTYAADAKWFEMQTGSYRVTTTYDFHEIIRIQ